MRWGFLLVHQTFSQLLKPINRSIQLWSHRLKQGPHLSCWSRHHTSLTPAVWKCLCLKHQWLQALTASGSVLFRYAMITSLYWDEIKGTLCKDMVGSPRCSDSKLDPELFSYHFCPSRRIRFANGLDCICNWFKCALLLTCRLQTPFFLQLFDTGDTGMVVIKISMQLTECYGLVEWTLNKCSSIGCTTCDCHCMTSGDMV